MVIPTMSKRILDWYKHFLEIPFAHESIHGSCDSNSPTYVAVSIQFTIEIDPISKINQYFALDNSSMYVSE